MRGIVAVAVVAILVTGAVEDAAAGVKTVTPNRAAGNDNILSIGASAGAIGERDATFWGLSADYTRILSRDWSLTASLTFDQETERR